MEASTTAGPLTRSLEIPSWKSVGGNVLALFVAVLFVGAGVYKAVDPFRVSRMFEELLVPSRFSLALVLTLAIAEMFGGAMTLVPRFRRWGSALTSLLLVIFMIYIGSRYSQLVGKDCSCFPWVKRTVGPAFFIGDLAFLAASLLAGWWAKPASGVRSAAVALGAIAVFAGVSFGSALAHQSGAKAPDSVVVDGKPFSLQHGRIFLFFFDPECSHCNAAARHMSAYRWKDVVIVGIPTRQPQFAGAFMRDDPPPAGQAPRPLKGVVSLDLQKLKAVFPFGDPPYGVALENGREIGPVQSYDDDDAGTEPAATLRKLGFID
ncbi:MAG TPA: MauE/DoxX family redox-associated membrane protein [Bryobacteraceae bacterium]|nr:MauE/DoxX family redox-associated membrane protein [Bryobacteraceae bacterium]